MRKNIVKKLNISIIAFSFLVSNVTSFAEANIIIAPTKTPPTTTYAETYYYYDSYGNIINQNANTVVSPEAEVISSFSYESGSIDYMTVHNIVEENNNYYCYENGAPVRDGWRKISRRSFAEFAPVDAYHDSYIWAYFASNGRAVKASSGRIKNAKIGNYNYAFNEYGQLLLGYFNDSGEMWDDTREEDPFDLLSDNNSLYHSDETTGIMTAGWYKMRNITSRYPNKNSIWLYFNPSNFKITRSTSNNYKSLTVNGKSYAFDDNGVMLTGFEASQYNEEHGGTLRNVYFGSDGAEIKNGFFNVDLSDDYAYDKYEEYEDTDEDITIYLSKSGQVYTNIIKKIGSAYYGFDHNGVLLKGLTVWDSNGYVATIDTDDTDAKSFISSGIYSQKYGGGKATLSSNESLHYFDDRGKRLTSAKLFFSDNTYNYEAISSGAINGLHNKKYYVHGLLIKPEDSKYGVFITSPKSTYYTMEELSKTNNVVVNSNGTVQNGSSIFRDDNDNYWLVMGSSLQNVYSVNIKKSGGSYSFKGTASNGREEWIPFGTGDIHGKTCTEEVLPNGTRLANGAISYYQTKISSDQAINFYIR